MTTADRPPARRASNTAAVLLLTDVFPPAIGGSGELLANVYSRLGDTPVSVLTTTAPHDQSTGSHVRVIRDSIPTSHWGVVNPRGLRRHLRRLRQVRGLTRGVRTVVHCGRALPEGLAAWAHSRLYGTPYVCWVHGEEIAYARQSRELIRLMTTVYAGAQSVIANSHNTAEMLAPFGVHQRRVTVVHPGVDANRFRPDAPSRAEARQRFAPSNEIVLLTVGRLQRRKGHDLVLDALSRLLSHYPSLRYLIAGDGQEKTRLEQIVMERGLGNHVTFLGAVPAEGLSACYSAADIFVHPNRIDGSDFEGFGIVFLEAAASGLPVIAGRSGGAPEAVDDGRTGLLVSGTNPEELASAISTLVADPEQRRRMGEVGRARVLSDFSWERAAALVRRIHERGAQAVLTGR